MKKAVYLDYASTTPMSDEVYKSMLPYLKDDFYNPSALYIAAKKVHHALEGARGRCAKVLEVRPSELVFAAGSTEANVIAIRGVMEQFKGAHYVLSSIEHDSVVETAKDYDYSLAPVTADGITDVAALERLITDQTVLVSCMSANNEVGTLQPLQQIVAVVENIRKKRAQTGDATPLYIHVDASQSFNYVPLLPHKLGADLVVVGGSKIYGPKQTAVLYVKTSTVLKPLITGGGQEYGLRSGTENVAGIVGFATAMQEAAQLRTTEQKRLAGLQQNMVARLQKDFPNATINGSLKHRLPNNIHMTFKNVDNETLVMQLDEKGFMVATGSACSASNDEPSHVLLAMGLTTQEAQSSIRVSLGRDTSQKDTDDFIATLAQLLHG